MSKRSQRMTDWALVALMHALFLWQLWKVTSYEQAPIREVLKTVIAGIVSLLFLVFTTMQEVRDHHARRAQLLDNHPEQREAHEADIQEAGKRETRLAAPMLIIVIVLVIVMLLF
jgi:hypothetical protein